MPNLTMLLDDGALAATATGAAYTFTSTVAGLTAVFARDPARRDDARKVLKILLLRGRYQRRHDDRKGGGAARRKRSS
jgi:hypothetical protein